MGSQEIALERAFRPSGNAADSRLVLGFVAAQGWAGLPVGDFAAKLEDQGLSPSQFLWWAPGASGEVVAAALLARSNLALLVPTSEGRAAARALVAEQLSGLHRVAAVEGQIDGSQLAGMEVHRRIVTLAPELAPALPGRPPVRRARLEDAESLFEIYDRVSWMRRESPENWSELLAREPTWVAELEGRVVSVARWTRAFGKDVEVGGVATHPDFRRRGAAAAATRAAAEAALESDRRPVLRYGDPELAALYHPLGFHLVGREQVFYRSS